MKGGAVSDKYEALSFYFGYSSFRPGQEKIIDTVLSGRDILAVMPTGAGKSLCFQIPALLMPGVTVVISPLISLMKDQITALKENGISAAALNSSMSSAEADRLYKNAERGKYKLIYVAPERLDTERFRRLSQSLDISFVCIDEAHCVSQWGQDFRSSYLRISDYISTLKRRPVVAAFTATATKIVREDIFRLTGLKEPESVIMSFDRKNLYFEVRRTENKYSELKQCLDSRRDKSTIIYCSTRRTVDELQILLSSEGFSALRYHAGLTPEERKKNQELFTNDDVRIMVATNAFGMGIDKSNVGLVIHYNMPGDIESYYQEAGRAGRDGENADCILLFSKEDIAIQKFFINSEPDNEEMTVEEKESMKLRRLRMLDSMVYYCHGRVCLRQFMLAYFGENYGGKCNNCSVCSGIKTHRNITVAAQKILSGVARTGQSLSLTELVLFLKGEILSDKSGRRLSEIRTFGILRELTNEAISEITEFLISEGYLKTVSDTEGSHVRLTVQSKQVLSGTKSVYMQVKAKLKAADEGPVKPLTAETNRALLSILKVLRKKTAMRASVPPFAVFSDATLREMAEKKPVTKSELLRIQGISIKKCERYGEDFVNAIKLYLSENTKN